MSNFSASARYEELMQAALTQAQAAANADEVPIGAVVARDGEIISAAHNRRMLDADPTAHAEMLAIRAAAGVLGDWRLTGCELVVTLEPCCMCAGAIVLARLGRVIYGAADPKAGAVDTLYNICRDQRLNHTVDVVSGVLAGQCGKILSDFFKSQREKGKK